MVKKSENKKTVKIIIILVIGIVSLMLLYVGHFLLRSSEEILPEPQDTTAVEDTAEAVDTVMQPIGNPVKYIHRSETINGLKQEINILEINPGAPSVKIQPVLSHDLIYGFEPLSEMSARRNACAAVNGGFFRDFGLPSGMVVINGELFSKSTGDYPVFVIQDGKAEFRQIDSELSIEFWRSVGGNVGIGEGGDIGSGTGTSEGTDAGKGAGTGKLSLDNINFPASGKQTAVYTPAYGKNNRAQSKNITATVEGGVITRIADYTGEAAIPDDGMLISFFDTQKYAGIELPFRVGDSVKLIHKPDMTGDVEAYECGSWLVRDGVTVVKDKDAWVGVLTNRDPRTAVGVREDGTVLLLTVDGRQPGYSAGFTGMELAEYLIGCGVKDAAMLDGGASTEMLLEGRLVSRPSHKGEERPLAGGILVLLE